MSPVRGCADPGCADPGCTDPGCTDIGCADKFPSLENRDWVEMSITDEAVAQSRQSTSNTPSRRANYSALNTSYGASRGGMSATPNVIGDFFGGAAFPVNITRRVQNNFFAFGFDTMTPGVRIFEADDNMDGIFNDGSANDFFSIAGTGSDGSGDSIDDTFSITEPIPPTDVPVSPGAGFVFDGGTVVLTRSTNSTQPVNGTPVDGDIWAAQYSYTESLQAFVAAGGSAAVRRIKISENNSPIPRHRLYFTYNYFNDVPAGLNDVNRYTFGFEKPFYDDVMSIDVRFPFAGTLAADQITGQPSARGTEFGNINATLKAILLNGQNWMLSGGLGVAMPTGSDSTVSLADGTQILSIENESVHLIPFVAWLHTNNRAFFQTFVQLDLDANGNSINGDVFGGALPEIGTLNDASLFMLDASFGYWAYQNPSARGITSIAPVAELHYTSTLSDADRIVANGFDITSLSNRTDVLNLTLGAHIGVGPRMVITPAMVIPLREDDDKQFDYEAAVQANVYY